MLPPVELERIFETLHNAYQLLPGLEITLEANPGTVDLHYLRDLRSFGVNRLSLGVQSAQPDELRLLERLHNFPDVIQAVEWSRQAGFDNLNLDLIYGLPGQSLASWQSTLRQVIQLQPEHLSLYSLTLEPGTPLTRRVQSGQLPELDPDLAADMYEWATQTLAQSDYFQYEISNWAVDQRFSDRTESSSSNKSIFHIPKSNIQNPPLACSHNLQYWRNLPYLGFGAGAHGYANQVRTANVLSPRTYIERLQPGELSARAASLPFPRTPATHTFQSLMPADEIADTMLMGLRLTREGVSDDVFYTRFGQALRQVFERQIVKLTAQGLLEWAGGDHPCLRLTSRGRLLGNRVFREFI